MKTPRIVILGPQGAGKGTQASFLKHRFHIPHISAGDVLREEIASGSALGKKIATIINTGSMLPDDMTNTFMRKRLSRPDCRPGWIVDGYPRSFEQAKPFQRFGQPNIVLYLHFSDKDAIRRLGGRRVCPKGHIYHIRHDRPEKRGRCDYDNLPLKQRDDDTPHAIRKRLRIFHTRTEPVIEWYRRRNMVITVDARKTIRLVHRDILQHLKKFLWLSSPIKRR